MALSVGSPLSAAPLAGTVSPGALQAQLDRARTQLADCVACGSADTPEGKTRIQALTRQVRDLEARLETARQARSPEPPVAAAQDPDPDPNRGRGFDQTV